MVDINKHIDDKLNIILMQAKLNEYYVADILMKYLNDKVTYCFYNDLDENDELFIYLLDIATDLKCSETDLFYLYMDKKYVLNLDDDVLERNQYCWFDFKDALVLYLYDKKLL